MHQLKSILTLVLVGAWPCLASAGAAQTYSVSPHGDGLGRFNVFRGQPVIWAQGARVGPAGNALDVQGQQERTTIVHFGTRKPLCYPLKGNDPLVRLGAGDDTGSEWIAVKVGGRGGSEHVTFQAGAGEFQGWYLSCEEKEETVEVGGTALRYRRMILSQKPGRIDYFSRYPVAK